MVEKRAKRLCYNCDDLFTPNHECKNLYWIEIAEDITILDEVENDHNCATLSLNAITG